MSSQFVHIQTYSRRGSSHKKASGSARGASGVIGEAKRTKHYCAHVDDPQPPGLVWTSYDVDNARQALDTFKKEVLDDAKQAVYENGKRLRVDAPAMLAGVASFPVPRTVVDGDLALQADYSQWKLLATGWAKKQFGEHLKVVIEHTDEPFYHLHFYAKPGLNPNKTMDISKVHPGIAAREEAARNGATGAEKMQAFKAAMSRFQDGFHEEVGQWFNHARVDPQRPRYPRGKWLAMRDGQGRETTAQAPQLPGISTAPKAKKQDAEPQPQQPVKPISRQIAPQVPPLPMTKKNDKAKAKKAVPPITRSLIAPSVRPGAQPQSGGPEKQGKGGINR